MENQTIETPTTKRKKKPPKQVDIKKAIKLRTQGMSYQTIADIQGTTRQAIHQALQDLLPTDTTKAFQEQRADILSHMQLRLLQSIDNEDIKKAPMGSRVLAACQIYDKERIERGLSTSNHAIIHADIEALRKQAQPDDYEVIDLDE